MRIELELCTYTDCQMEFRWMGIDLANGMEEVQEWMGRDEVPLRSTTSISS